MYGHPLVKRLRVLILFRALFVTLLLGSSFLFNIADTRFSILNAPISLIGVLYLLSVIYWVLLPKVKNLAIFAYTQLSVDVICEVYLVFLTGGIGSLFSSIMLITVMSSVIILDKKAGYIIATLCCVLYGFIGDLQYYRMIPLSYNETAQAKDFLYNIFTHILALYLTAFLTGHLSWRLEKASRKLEEKDSDLKALVLFNNELIENLPSGLLTTDTSGKIAIFNKAAEHITGVRREEAAGKNITDLFPFVTRPFEVARKEGTVSCKGRNIIIGLTISGVMDSEGEKTGYICVFQDITQLKNLEAELKYKETLAAIGELAANMAHEIRNPLASLKSSIEILKEGVLTKDNSERLMHIALSEMDRLNKIITDFLTYSRPNAPECSWFDLNRMLDETVGLLEHLIGSGRVSIIKNLDSQQAVFADPCKMRQVFLNLGMNAIESMPEGGTLSINTRRVNGDVTVFFKDTGIGIPPQHIKDIFYPFFTTKETGTGLGLSIAYRIIEEHCGRIHVHSIPGKGTTFEVVFPVSSPAL
jgi:two-component system sensor histidine kinase PilS (NtrC family)